MANEKMTMAEAYTCPRCGGQAVNIGAMEQLFSDARMEDVVCMKCNSAWKLFYKMSDFNKKIIHITDTPLDDAASNDVEVVKTENEDCHIVGENGIEPSREPAAE